MLPCILINYIYVWYFNHFDHKIKITTNIKVVFFSHSRQVLSLCCYVKYSSRLCRHTYSSFLSMFYITENVRLYISANPFIIKTYRKINKTEINTLSLEWQWQAHAFRFKVNLSKCKKIITETRIMLLKYYLTKHRKCRN